MTSVRDAAFELFRARGMTTIFGNPGSTELPMLGPLPDDFRYVLGLQEAVAVGMADGFAQASGNVTHVNLHTAPGARERRGGDLQRTREQGAAAGHRRPAGARADDPAGEPHQPRRGGGAKALCEVELRAPTTRRCPLRARAGDPPREPPPAGPAFVSIPMDDWASETRPGRLRHADRAPGGRPGATRPRRDRRARTTAALRRAAGVRSGSRDRCQRRLGHGARAGGVRAPAGVGLPRHRRRTDRLPREPPRLPGSAATRGGTARTDARRV